jgi:hypothetical protein
MYVVGLHDSTHSTIPPSYSVDPQCLISHTTWIQNFTLLALKHELTIEQLQTDTTFQ